MNIKLIIIEIITAFTLCTGIAFSDVSVYPVPWVPESGNPSKNGDYTGIKFAGVPAGGEIDIYTVSGNLVRKITNDTGATNTIIWDGKNSSGAYVASAVYLWVVKSPGKTQTGKLIVVR